MTPGLGSECGVILYPTSPEWVPRDTSTKTTVLETSRKEKKNGSNIIRGDGIGIRAGKEVEVIAEQARLSKVSRID